MGRPKRNVSSKPLNLKIDDKLRKRMERLRDKTESGSLSELVRRAVAVYEFVVAAQTAGERIVAMGEGGEREVIIL